MFLRKDRNLEICCGFGKFEGAHLRAAERSQLKIQLRIGGGLSLLHDAVDGRSVSMAREEADEAIPGGTFAGCLPLSFIAEHHQQCLPE
jgi:hypothetical protein